MPCSRAPAGAPPPSGDEDRTEYCNFPCDRDHVVPDRPPIECAPDVKEEGPGGLEISCRERPERHQPDRWAGIDVEEVEQEVAGPAGERGQTECPGTRRAAGGRDERDHRRHHDTHANAVSLRLMMVHPVEELPGEVEIGRQGGAHRDGGTAARRQLSRGGGGDVYG